MVPPLMKAGYTTFRHPAHSFAPARERLRSIPSERDTQVQRQNTDRQVSRQSSALPTIADRNRRAASVSIHQATQTPAASGQGWREGGRLIRPRSNCRFIFLRKIDPHVLVRGELFEGGIHDGAEMKAAELAGERA